MKFLTQRFLQSALFAIVLAGSGLMIAAVLRDQVGKRVVGVCLIVFLLVTILYATSWYLRTIWSLAGRFTGGLASKMCNPAQHPSALEQVL